MIFKYFSHMKEIIMAYAHFYSRWAFEGGVQMLEEGRTLYIVWNGGVQMLEEGRTVYRTLFEMGVDQEVRKSFHLMLMFRSQTSESEFYRTRMMCIL